MKVKLYNQLGEETGSVELLDAIFNIPLNHDLVHQAIVTQMANSREILAHAKGRGEVRGGGKKPWRQKGTGRARHGSIRSPIWKGGGVTHGPLKEKIYSKKINKKVEKPIVTEKAVSLSGGNKYVFRVSPKTNKVEVRKAIEKLYDVKVKDIRVINVIAKKRQVGSFEGWRSGFKKAIITLEKGFSIEISHS